MPLIIDGHNLIGKMRGISLSDPNDELKLVRLLNKYSSATGKAVTVVFDSGRDSSFKTLPSAQAVKVVFAERSSDADSIITEMIQRDPNPKGMTVVSSDRRIIQCARRFRCKVHSSTEFARKLAHSTSTVHLPRRRSSKQTGLSADEVEDWLEYFSGGGHRPGDSDAGST